MDVLTPEQRHYNMSQIQSKNTKPELIVRKWLWNQGYRYRLYRKDLPGKPDIVFPKYNAVIFVHGCFWHRHDCKYASTPVTRKDFWEEKLNGNVRRDKANAQRLIELKWRVLVIWECEIKKWDTVLERKIIDFLTEKDNRFIRENDYDDTRAVSYIAAESEVDYASEDT
jgi:DNA mismatch endonuclease (patch repair protein)